MSLLSIFLSLSLSLSSLEVLTLPPNSVPPNICFYIYISIFKLRALKHLAPLAKIKNKFAMVLDSSLLKHLVLAISRLTGLSSKYLPVSSENLSLPPLLTSRSGHHHLMTCLFHTYDKPTAFYPSLLLDFS